MLIFEDVFRDVMAKSCLLGRTVGLRPIVFTYCTVRVRVVGTVQPGVGCQSYFMMLIVHTVIHYINYTSEQQMRYHLYYFSVCDATGRQVVFAYKTSLNGLLLLCI